VEALAETSGAIAKTVFGAYSLLLEGGLSGEGEGCSIRYSDGDTVISRSQSTVSWSTTRSVATLEVDS